MIFVSFLLLTAAEAAPAVMTEIKLDCRRDSVGNCLPVELSPPAELLREQHDYSAAIYRPYWVCYWKALNIHEDFGTSDGERATQIFVSAFNICASLRASADGEMDALLRPLTIYGDKARKHFVRDDFRSSAGARFLVQAAQAAGQRDAYTRTREATHQFVLRRVENVRKQ